MGVILNGPNAGRETASFYMLNNRRATFAERWRIAKDAMAMGKPWPGFWRVWASQPEFFTDTGEVNWPLDLI